MELLGALDFLKLKNYPRLLVKSNCLSPTCFPLLVHCPGSTSFSSFQLTLYLVLVVVFTCKVLHLKCLCFFQVSSLSSQSDPPAPPRLSPFPRRNSCKLLCFSESWDNSLLSPGVQLQLLSKLVNATPPSKAWLSPQRILYLLHIKVSPYFTQMNKIQSNIINHGSYVRWSEKKMPGINGSL